jgi:hypothetical protein
MKEKKTTVKKKPVATKKKKVVARVKKPNFEKIIMDIISKDGDLILITIDKGISFLVKKKTETVRKELNPGSMTPVETFEVVTFCHLFALIWDNKILKKINYLEHAGLPVYFVESEYDIIEAIRNS